LWSEHYSNLLNETASNSNDVDHEFGDYVENEVTQMDSTFLKDHDNTGTLSNPITVNEVAGVCMSMPNKKSAGMDNISYESLKYGGHVLFQKLSELYNSIITFSYIPAGMKHSIIIPIYKGKKKPRNNMNSYRGISLNQTINKILEKIILNRLKPWLKENNIPAPQQHACTEGCSSVTLSYVVQEVINHFRNRNSKLFTCFVDIEKAFDTVWWSGLLYKMSKMGIKHKLWYLFKEWLKNSSCTVSINGKFSKSFPITRSIKQGGLLSMLMFCISYHDVHTEVILPPSQGITYHNVDVSSLTFADDTLLMANSVNGLQRMLNNLHNYGRKWRIKFSPTKTVCMTFGESQHAHFCNKDNRCWYLGNIKLDEVSHIMYLGNKMCAYNSSKERSKDMSRRAYMYLGNLTSIGFHALGLSPETNAVLWKRLCIPSMLFSCETWGDLTKKEYYLFEKSQRTVAKQIQGLARRTHNEIVLGLLGWHTVEGQIDQCKLRFVSKLVNMSGITKLVFIHEIYICLFETCTNTITSDLVRILKKYNLYAYLLNYLKGRQFPDKQAWKHIVKENISKVEEAKWRIGLINKNANRYLRVQPYLQINQLYRIIKKNLFIRDKIMNLVKLLTIVEEDELMLCPGCDDILTDSVDHYFMRCKLFIHQRNKMWDKILDSMDVHAEVRLIAKDDVDMLDILLGKESVEIINNENVTDIYCSIADYVVHIFKVLEI